MYLLVTFMLLAPFFTEVSGSGETFYNVFEVEKLCFENGTKFKQAADDTMKYPCKIYCQCPSDTNVTRGSIRDCELCCCIIGKIHRIKDAELKEKDKLIKTVKNDYENETKQRNEQIQHMKNLSDNKTKSLHECRVKLVEKDFQYREYQNHTDINTRRSKIALSNLQYSLSKKEDECRDYVIATGISGAFNILFIATATALLFCFCKKRRKTTTYSFTYQQQVPVSQQVGLDNQINVQINLPEDDETSNTQSDTQQHQRCPQEKLIPEITSHPKQETLEQPKSRKQEKEKKVIPGITSHPEQETLEQPKSRKREKEEKVIPENLSHPEQEPLEQPKSRKREKEEKIIPEITSHPEQETLEEPKSRKREKEEKVIPENTSHPDEETLELKEIPSSSNKTSTKKNDISSGNQQTNRNRMKNSSQFRKESLNPLEATSLLNQEKKEQQNRAFLSHQKREKSFDIISLPNQETCQQLEIHSNDENKAQPYLSENASETNVSENIALIDTIQESNRIKNFKLECSNHNENQEEILNNLNTGEEVNRTRPFSHLLI